MRPEHHSDDTIDVFQQLLTLALGEQLTIRNKTLWIAGAPPTIVDQLAASVLYCYGWLYWYPQPDGVMIGLPTIIGRRMLDLWNKAFEEHVEFTDADETAFHRAVFYVTPDDIKDQP